MLSRKRNRESRSRLRQDGRDRLVHQLNVRNRRRILDNLGHISTRLNTLQHVSTISPPYLDHISTISRPYLDNTSIIFISSTFRPYFDHISTYLTISQLYIDQISTKSRPDLDRISTGSRSDLDRISTGSRPYFDRVRMVAFRSFRLDLDRPDRVSLAEISRPFLVHHGHLDRDRASSVSLASHCRSPLRLVRSIGWSVDRSAPSTLSHAVRTLRELSH